jgi:hypothetical protein
VALLSAGIAEEPVGVLGRLVVGDGALLESNSVIDGQDAGGGRDDVLALLGGLDVLGGSVTALGPAVAAGEEDETLLVLLEALDVGLEALLGEVLAAGVDGNADSGCELAGDASLCMFVSGSSRSRSRELVMVLCTLQLSQGEATAGADTAVVCQVSVDALSFALVIIQQTYT